MSYGTKSNGRDYVNRSNANQNKMNPMNSRTNMNVTQHSNLNNGDSYVYESKNQHNPNSPKTIGENYPSGGQQSMSSARDHYMHKAANNSRQRSYVKFCDKSQGYYSGLQRPSSPTDVSIPDIDNLRQFVKDQMERFRTECNRYEAQCGSPSPSSNHDSSSHKSYKSSFVQMSSHRNDGCMQTSMSMGSIVNSSCTVSPNTNQTSLSSDYKQQQNAYNSKGGGGYNSGGYKQMGSGGSQVGGNRPNFIRNPSYEDNYTSNKSSLQQAANKSVRVDSPNSGMDKTVSSVLSSAASSTMGAANSSKSQQQYSSPQSSSSNSVTVNNTNIRQQDPKKVQNAYRGPKQMSFSYAVGSNPTVHQYNTNNGTTAVSVANDLRKTADNHQQQQRQIVRNGFSNGKSNSGGGRRSNVKLDAGGSNVECSSGSRVVVSVAESKRQLSLSASSSNGGMLADCGQEQSTNALGVPDSVLPAGDERSGDTPKEQFYTPDPPASPCSNRSSPDQVSAKSGTASVGIYKNNNTTIRKPCSVVTD